MLRIGCLVLIHAGIILISSGISPCYAQLDRDVAPWRLTENGDSDLLQPEGVDPNRALLPEFLTIPGINPDLAYAIIDYRKNNPSFVRLEDLFNIPGFDKNEIADLRSFFTFRPDSGQYTPDLILKYRTRTPFNEKEGKSPFKLGEKLIFKNSSDLSFGLAMEKDPGEALFWDHASFALKVPLPDDRGEVILGDMSQR